MEHSVPKLYFCSNQFNYSFMKNPVIRPPDPGYLHLAKAAPIHYQLSPAQLIESAIILNEGRPTDTGALAIDTGAFTGRSPKDRFICK